MKVAQSCLTLPDPIDCSPPGSCPWNSPGKNTGMGSYSFLQGIFLTQRLHSGLLHCTQILYLLGHQGSHRNIWDHTQTESTRKRKLNFGLLIAGPLPALPALFFAILPSGTCSSFSQLRKTERGAETDHMNACLKSLWFYVITRPLWFFSHRLSTEDSRSDLSLEGD